MGLLSQGSPLNWTETKKYADHVRKHGIVQFLNIYNKVKDRQKDVLKWGDEVSEVFIHHLSQAAKTRDALHKPCAFGSLTCSYTWRRNPETALHALITLSFLNKRAT